MSYHYDVYFRNVETGETKIYHEDCEYEEKEDGLTTWTIGNYECDCNRSLFMYDHDEEKELDCNTGEHIIVVDKIVLRETGEILIENI